MQVTDAEQEVLDTLRVRAMTEVINETPNGRLALRMNEINRETQEFQGQLSDEMAKVSAIFGKSKKLGAGDEALFNRSVIEIARAMSATSTYHAQFLLTSHVVDRFEACVLMHAAIRSAIAEAGHQQELLGLKTASAEA